MQNIVLNMGALIQPYFGQSFRQEEALACAEERGLPILGCMLDVLHWKFDISPLFQKHGKHFMLHAGPMNPASGGLFRRPMLAVGSHEDVMEIVTDKADVLVPIYAGALPPPPGIIHQGLSWLVL